MAAMTAMMVPQQQGDTGAAGAPPPERKPRKLSRKAQQAAAKAAGPRVIVAETVADYRALIAVIIPPGSAVVEIGCCNGVTTAAIAASGLAAPGRCLGVDHDELQLGLARRRWPELPFRCCDALDISALRRLLLAEGFGEAETAAAAATAVAGGSSGGGQTEDSSPARRPQKRKRPGGHLRGDIVLFVDINGSRELKTLIPALNSYASCLKPTLMVVKNWRLAHLVRSTELSSTVLQPAAATATATAAVPGARPAATVQILGDRIRRNEAEIARRTVENVRLMEERAALLAAA
jgi:hypothetical protein